MLFYIVIYEVFKSYDGVVICISVLNKVIKCYDRFYVMKFYVEVKYILLFMK